MQPRGRGLSLDRSVVETELPGVLRRDPVEELAQQSSLQFKWLARAAAHAQSAPWAGTARRETARAIERQLVSRPRLVRSLAVRNRTRPSRTRTRTAAPVKLHLEARADVARDAKLRLHLEGTGVAAGPGVHVDRTAFEDQCGGRGKVEPALGSTRTAIPRSVRSATRPPLAVPMTRPAPTNSRQPKWHRPFTTLDLRNGEGRRRSVLRTARRTPTSSSAAVARPPIDQPIMTLRARARACRRHSSRAAARTRIIRSGGTASLGPASRSSGPGGRLSFGLSIIVPTPQRRRTQWRTHRGNACLARVSSDSAAFGPTSSRSAISPTDSPKECGHLPFQSVAVLWRKAVERHLNQPRKLPALKVFVRRHGVGRERFESGSDLRVLPSAASPS